MPGNLVFERMCALSLPCAGHLWGAENISTVPLSLSSCLVTAEGAAGGSEKQVHRSED